MEDAKKFRRCLAQLLRKHGPQGWWPRLVSEKGEWTVRHHPGPKSRWLSRSASDQAFEVAVGAILTQNTAWTSVEKALVCLAAKGLTTSRALAQARLPSIEACIRSSGYYRQKAKKLKLFAKYAEEDLGGELNRIMSFRGKSERRGIFKSEQLSRMPSGRSLHVGRDDILLQAREILLSLWGIGPETADTILLYGLNRPVFVVDTYTRRLLVRLTGDASWSKKSYDEVRLFCESALAKPSVEDFQEHHALIVRWGKEKS